MSDGGRGSAGGPCKPGSASDDDNAEERRDTDDDVIRRIGSTLIHRERVDDQAQAHRRQDEFEGAQPHGEQDREHRYHEGHNQQQPVTTRRQRGDHACDEYDKGHARGYSAAHANPAARPPSTPPHGIPSPWLERESTACFFPARSHDPYPGL